MSVLQFLVDLAAQWGVADTHLLRVLNSDAPLASALAVTANTLSVGLRDLCLRKGSPIHASPSGAAR